MCSRYLLEHLRVIDLVRQKGHVFQKCSQWMQLHSMAALTMCILTCTKVFDLKRHSCLKKHKRECFKYRDSRIYGVEVFLRNYSDRRLVRERVDCCAHR